MTGPVPPPAPTLERLADGVWIAAGAAIRYPGIAFPIRMVVLQLADGGVLLHSPVQYSPQLAAAVTDLGPIKGFVAPNNFHHLFLVDWQTAFAEVPLYAVAGLAKKRADIAIAHTLGDEPPTAWGDAVELALFRGNRITEEAMLFHRPSRTAVLTDLILNLDVTDASWFGRAFARFDQVAAPNGGTPRLFRWTMKDRDAARASIARLLDWPSERVVFAHGDFYHHDGQAKLREQFRWLTAQR